MSIVLSMDIHPHVVGFILFCAKPGKRWPEIYDEMCRVAGQGLYHGLTHKDLRELGFSLGLTHIDKTIKMVEQVTSLSLRKPAIPGHA